MWALGPVQWGLGTGQWVPRNFGREEGGQSHKRLNSPWALLIFSRAAAMMLDHGRVDDPGEILHYLLTLLEGDVWGDWRLGIKSLIPCQRDDDKNQKEKHILFAKFKKGITIKKRKAN